MNTALITGASYGIGAAFARALATRQTNLILVARSQERLQRLARALESEFAIKVQVIVQDLSQPDGSQAVRKVVNELGWQVDLLVNNAGFGDYGEFAQQELTRQLNMIQLNISAMVALTHYFLPGMQARGSGNIINVSSIAGFQPLPYLSVYAASKAFVLSFTEALWAENRETGVHCLALCPGPTETEFFVNAKMPLKLANNNSSSLTSAEVVVQQALDALEKKESTLVTGGLANQFIVNVSRFLPRSWLVSAVEKQFRV